MMSASTTTPVHKSNNSEYASIIVGHGSSTVTIQTLVTPSIHAFIPDKVMAFDFLFTQLRIFHPTLNITDLTTALSNHFDVNHSVARSKTAAIVALLQSALFRSENLSGIHFIDRAGVLIKTVDEDPAKRQDNIAFFVFDVTFWAVMLTGDALPPSNRSPSGSPFPCPSMFTALGLTYLQPPL